MQRHRLVLAVVAVLALAGCSGGTTPSTTMSAKAQQLQNESTTAMQDVETYHVELSMSAESDRGSVSMEANGVINRPARRARLSMTVESPTDTREIRTYIVNQTAYRNSHHRWVTQNVSEQNMWERNSRLQRQRELLANSPFEITGTTWIDGTEVIVVSVAVPEDTLDELTAMARQQSGGDGGTVTNVQYTAYIAAESKLTREIQADFAVEVDGRRVDTSITMTFQRFGTETDITVPEEATAGTGITTTAQIAAG